MIAAVQENALRFAKGYGAAFPLYTGERTIRALERLIDVPMQEDVEALAVLFDDEMYESKSLPEAMHWQVALMMLRKDSDAKIRAKRAQNKLYDCYKAFGSQIKALLHRP